MLNIRVIPVLLLKENGLVKTVKFKNPKYIGDPINTIRIFNEKEVDELFVLDIRATPEMTEPNYQMIEDVAGEAFMPVAYGGGIKNIEQVRRVFSLGIEKIVINNTVFENNKLLQEAISEYGAQAIVVCIDCRKTITGKYELYSHSGEVKRKIKLNDHLKELSKYDVGEILVNSIDRDGTQKGYDIDLLKLVSSQVTCPVVACGGAGSIDDFVLAINDGQVSAVAAGSLFVFKGKHKAVLISYPDRKSLNELLS